MTVLIARTNAVVTDRAGKPAVAARRPLGLILFIPVILVVAVGLFGRIMAYPLRHDEQMYLPVGLSLSRGDLYADFGFNNLPNLPLLMHGIFSLTASDHILLTGRLTIFAGWVLAAVSIALLVKRITRSTGFALLAALLLAVDPLLLGPAGMIVTNNFLPVGFTLAATYLLVAGADRPTPSPFLLAASGLALGIAVGFKANYVFALPPFAIALLMAPAGLPVAVRLSRMILPFILGALVGASPTLVYLLTDPSGFLVHVLGYHSGPHEAYWNANRSLNGEKIIGLADKVKFAARIWIVSPFGLVIAALGLTALARRYRRASSETDPAWPVRLLAGMIACGVLVSFVPTPAFPQYYAPPVPFAIALASILAARSSARPTGRFAPHVPVAILILACILALPRLVLNIPAAFQPSVWSGTISHDRGRQLADIVGQANGGTLVATLAPLYVVEGGLRLVPELTTGPLVYRVGDYIPAWQRPHYALISPTSLNRRLAQSRPAAILVGFEGALDAPFETFAKNHHYRVQDLGWPSDRYGRGVLYVRPGARDRPCAPASEGCRRKAP